MSGIEEIMVRMQTKWWRAPYGRVSYMQRLWEVVADTVKLNELVRRPAFLSVLVMQFQMPPAACTLKKISQDDGGAPVWHARSADRHKTSCIQTLCNKNKRNHHNPDLVII